MRRRDGYGVRIYLPYGLYCYGYFLRRLAVRRANLWFLLRHLMVLGRVSAPPLHLPFCRGRV
jgi:hypothetical protein